MTRTRRLGPALCCLVLLACEPREPSPTPASASDVTRSIGATEPVTDERADAFLRSGDAAPGYLDQVSGTVTAANERTLRFVDHLAAALAPGPELPKGDAAIGWSFCLDTNPGQAPIGFPMESVRPCEFVLRVRWDGRDLQGLLIDRRPLMEGRYSQIQTVQPRWRKRSMELLIPLENLGNPERFDWSVSTEEFRSLSSDVVYHVDELPEGGVSAPATWRSE